MQKSSNSLEYRHISRGAATALEFIDLRRKGLAPSLKTSFPKLNSVLLDGIDWYRIFTIAGLSGSGKSTIAENLKRDFIALNPKEKFKILSFEFEMRIEDQIARNLSSRIHKSVKEIYSASEPLDEASFNKIEELLKETESSPVYYVDNVGSVSEIIATIEEFATNMQLLEKGEGLVVTIDHLLLTKDKTGDGERAKIDSLMYELTALKKYYSSIGLKCLFITLSQLNRDIKTGDRVLKRSLHFPTQNDLFAASSVYFCSDYVLITHNPSTVEGLGLIYGPSTVENPNGLPVRCPSDTSRAMIYWHVIKERFGETKIISMVEDFKNSRLEEYQLK